MNNMEKEFKDICQKRIIDYDRYRARMDDLGANWKEPDVGTHIYECREGYIYFLEGAECFLKYDVKYKRRISQRLRLWDYDKHKDAVKNIENQIKENNRILYFIKQQKEKYRR